MQIDLSSIHIPLGGVLSLLGTVVISVCGYLWMNGTKLLKKFNRIDLRVKDVCKDVDALKDQCKTADNRLIKIEDAISDIRSAAQRSDEQFKIITVKLETLIVGQAKLEETTKATAAIVPRQEVEARLKAHEDRLQAVEGRRGN